MLQVQKKPHPLKTWNHGKPWKNKTVVCVGGGPSLDHTQIAHAHRFDHVIAINDAYKLLPAADILYACDLKWWDWHNGVEDFDGFKITLDVEAAQKYNLIWIDSDKGSGFSITPGLIHQGQNSGYQAMNLAVLLGVKRIILIGYDMQFGQNGASHWFGDHPDKQRSDYRPWLNNFSTAATHAKLLGIEIINATSETALTCFKKTPIEEIH